MNDSSPTWNCDRACYEWWTHADGMSLRDYFAAKAMQGVMMTCSTEEGVAFLERVDPDREPGKGHAWMASLAYRMADAMLKARETP